ncbi:RNA polymerase sigma-70 factor [Sphingobacterium paucimobilis]|uniref:HTH luxR-type domain-containing protein n=1 Tax=Sphingobacterium paucimobilis HER1398 TaxID=1346330 RepID=U2J841_9SPHI|nr:RNA polymerase sigma-70 factor [Sphingobacterium paucimobilis]ERJ58833.1 hypothetical protein M472_08630 [Sphingobacterium paucimobilis HER1398]
MHSPSLLIDGLHKNKEQSLIAVYRLYNRKLLLFAMRYVKVREAAEEIVADSFIKMWNNRHLFSDEEKLKAFLYICTKNACLNYLRKPVLEDPLESILNTEFDLAQDVDVYTKMVHAELMAAIYKEVEKLSERQRKVFHMSFLEGLTVEEISQRLGVSTDVVYANRSRALAILRTHFKLHNSALLSALLYSFFS